MDSSIRRVGWPQVKDVYIGCTHDIDLGELVHVSHVSVSRYPFSLRIGCYSAPELEWRLYT